MANNRAKWVVTLVGGGLLCIGAVIWAAILFLVAVAALLTIADWEWVGPILWDRVLGLLLCPIVIGTLLSVVGYSITAIAREGPK